MVLLLWIFLDLVEFVGDVDTCFCEHLFRLSAGMIFSFADNSFNTAGNDEHGAGTTRCHTTVEGGTFDGDTDLGRLENGILFGMNGADTVIGYGAVFMSNCDHEMANIITVRLAGRRTNIASGNLMVVTVDDDAAGTASITSGSKGELIGNSEPEISPAYTIWFVG